MKKLHYLKMLMLSVWGASGDCKTHKTLLILGSTSPIALIVVLLVISPLTMKGVIALALIALFWWIDRKMSITTHFIDYQKVDRVAKLMTEILTLLHLEIGIRKPYDVYSVWMNPTRSEDGTALTYHAKARQSDSVQLDDDSLEEYVALINGRALDIGAPLAVTQIHPRGNTFVYDVSVSESVLVYVSPDEAKALDKDFSNKDRDF